MTPNQKTVFRIVGAVAGVYVLSKLFSGSSRIGGTVITSELSRVNPYSWGTSKQSLLRRWNTGPVGSTIRRMSPVAFPGVPYEAFMGFVANGTNRGETNADTALPPPYGVSNSFHELGIFGTEGGTLADSPRGQFPGIAGSMPLAPARTVTHNSWRRLANTSLVRQLLGKAASVEPNGWIPLEEQTAVGLANLRSHLSNVNSILGPDLAARELSSTWAIALAFGGWSAGDAGFAGHVRRFANDLSPVDERYRWETLLAAVANGVRNGTVTGHKHRNAAYSVMRTWQKLEAGRQLAASTGGNTAWFETGLAPGVAITLDQAYKAAAR